MASAFRFLTTPRYARDQGTPGQSTAGLVELSLYKEHPAGEISLEEFEKYALDRLRSEEQIKPSSGPGNVLRIPPHATRTAGAHAAGCGAPAGRLHQQALTHASYPT